MAIKAFTKDTKEILAAALASRKAAAEIEKAVFAGANPVAATISAPAAVSATFADLAAARAAVAALQGTVAGLIVKLKEAGLMAS